MESSKTSGAKVGLSYSLGKIVKHLKNETIFGSKIKINPEIAIYLGAVLEYLTAEVIEISGIESH